MGNQYTKQKEAMQQGINEVQAANAGKVQPAAEGATPPAPAANVYENGEGDERQQGDIQTSRFRPRYRKLNENELQLHDDIKTGASELETLFAHVTPKNPAAQRTLDRAFDALEDAVMLAIKAHTA